MYVYIAKYKMKLIAASALSYAVSALTLQQVDNNKNADQGLMMA
jgi:hypothetical protein